MRPALAALCALVLGAAPAGPASAIPLGSAKASAPADPALVLPSGGSWAITSVGGMPVGNASLTRRGARSGGSDGCVPLEGGFATNGLALDLPGIARKPGVATIAACDPASDRVLAALQAADGVNVVSDGTMELTAGGRVVLTIVRTYGLSPGEAVRSDAPAVTPRAPAVRP